MRLFAELIASVTGHPRERVPARWSNEYWISNIFCFWEQIAWRRQGIKLETTSEWDSDGQEIVFAHSWEAACCLTEKAIKDFFKSFALKRVRIYVPLLATPTGIQIPASPYVFAIAIVNAFSSVANGGTATVSAGSNVVAVAQMRSQSFTPSAITLNGSAMTKRWDGTSGTSGCSGWTRAAPSTGTLAYTGGDDPSGTKFLTLSGVDQTNPVDNAGASVATAAGTGSLTISSVVATGCWAVGFISVSDNIQSYTGFVVTVDPTSGAAEIFSFHSNGTIGTGSQSGGWSVIIGSQRTSGVMALQPVAAVGPTGVKTKDGVTQSTGIKTYFALALASVKSVEGVA